MEIKILQWNIWFKENIDYIIQTINEINPDIVCIQELTYTRDDMSNVKKLSKLFSYSKYAVADEYEDGSFICNGIYSKYPILKTFEKYVQEPSIDKDYSRQGRIYLEAEIEFETCCITVGTTHLSYTDKFVESELKDEEVNNLLELLKDKRSKYIFSGDLNTTKESKYINSIEEILTNYDTSATWTTKPFSYNGFEEKELKWKLDYVFTTDDINVKNVEVLKKIKYSDHLPILVTIEV